MPQLLRERGLSEAIAGREPFGELREIGHRRLMGLRVVPWLHPARAVPDFAETAGQVWGTPRFLFPAAHQREHVADARALLSAAHDSGRHAHVVLQRRLREEQHRRPASSAVGAFIRRLSEIGHTVGGPCYGVVRQERPDSERLEYHAAIEVSQVDILPDGMVSVEIPQATYAKFAHRGMAQNIDHSVSYAYSTWLAQSDQRHTYGADLEIYGDEYDPTSQESVIHYAIPTA